MVAFHDYPIPPDTITEDVNLYWLPNPPRPCRTTLPIPTFTPPGQSPLCPLSQVQYVSNLHENNNSPSQSSPASSPSNTTANDTSCHDNSIVLESAECKAASEPSNEVFSIG